MTALLLMALDHPYMTFFILLALLFVYAKLIYPKEIR